MELMEKWEIRKAKIYYDEIDAYKIRPVVIISPEESTVLVLKITTHEGEGKKYDYDYEIQNMDVLSLKEKSVIQCDQ